MAESGVLRWPVYLRVGDGQEACVGVVEVDPVDYTHPGEVDTAALVAAVLRGVADAMTDQPPGEQPTDQQEARHAHP